MPTVSSVCFRSTILRLDPTAVTLRSEILKSCHSYFSVIDRLETSPIKCIALHPEPFRRKPCSPVFLIVRWSTTEFVSLVTPLKPAGCRSLRHHDLKRDSNTKRVRCLTCQPISNMGSVASHPPVDFWDLSTSPHPVTPSTRKHHRHRSTDASMCPDKNFDRSTNAMMVKCLWRRFHSAIGVLVENHDSPEIPSRQMMQKPPKNRQYHT